MDFFIDEDDLVVGEMEADFGVVSLFTQIRSLNDEDFSNVIPLGGEREWPFGVFALYNRNEKFLLVFNIFLVCQVFLVFDLNEI